MSFFVQNAFLLHYAHFVKYSCVCHCLLSMNGELSFECLFYNLHHHVPCLQFNFSPLLFICDNPSLVYFIMHCSVIFTIVTLLYHVVVLPHLQYLKFLLYACFADNFLVGSFIFWVQKGSCLLIFNTIPTKINLVGFC